MVRREYGCNATLEGSGSLVVDGSEPPPLPPYEGDPAELYTDFLPPEATDQPSPPHLWFTVVDGRGRVRWTEKHPDWDVLVLVCRSTPADYLGYLQRERICYLVAGDDRVDLAGALARMATQLGVRCVLSTAGGGLNGALLRAGLIDELSLSSSRGSSAVWVRRRCWTGRRWRLGSPRRHCGCCRCTRTPVAPSGSATRCSATR